MLKNYPIIAIIAVTFLMFFKIFTLGEYPYPGNLLVSFNYPWYSGGWDGYDPWTTHKEFIAMDAIREHLPWHKLTFDEIKNNLSLPLWNPYNFSGFPHLGNMQTFILNPFNILFLVLPLFQGWIIFIILQVPLTISFTYLFARSLGLKKSSSLMAGIAYLFSSFFLNWLEIGIVGYSVLWLPLILYAIQEILNKNQVKYLLILIISTSAMIFAGHIQTAMFVIIVSIAYFLTKILIQRSGININKLLLIPIWLIIILLITSVQIIPGLELYFNSPLTEPLSKEVFYANVIPYKNFISLLAPDFFGNPATNNFWSVLYGDGTPFIGVIPFFFALFSILNFKRWEVKFFTFTLLIFALYTTKSPLFFLIKNLDIPFITGTAAARSMFVFCFALSVLSAFGLDSFLSNPKVKRNFYFLTVIFFSCYLILFAFTYLYPLINTSLDTSRNLKVSQRNLIIPILTFLVLPTSYYIFPKYKKLKKYWLVPVLSITIIAGAYQFNKGAQFSPQKYFYPQHPVFEWLQKHAGIYRFHGADTSRTWSNIPAYYKLFSAEGYGVFRIKRYAELFAAQDTGQISSYERSVAEFSDENTQNKYRLYNLLGIKYYLAKDDQSRDPIVQDFSKPDEENTKLVWSEGKFRIYERGNSLPRFWLTDSYQVIKDDHTILSRIYDPTFNLKTILLEVEPKISIGEGIEGAVVTLQTYKPNLIEFSLQNINKNLLFFISDTYFNGWNAYVNNRKSEILRADYTFRAVAVPEHTTKLVFKYEPNTVKLGSILSIIGLLMLSTIVIFKKTFGFNE